MKPLSYVYSYINIPQKDWNDLEVNIWLYNAMKSIGISAFQQNTKLISIVNHKANICEDYEFIKAVVVRKDVTEPKKVTDYETDDNGNILIPNGTYPIVQQTTNNQVSAIYPTLPVWFPMNNQKLTKLWFWAEPKDIAFEKVCKDCPTYCNNCEYVYTTDLDGNLFFPQIENGVACVNYSFLPKAEEYFIDEKNQYLVDALAAYVMKNFWEVKMNVEFTQQSKQLFELYNEKWSRMKTNARSLKLMNSFDIKRIQKIMNPDLKTMLR